MLVVEQVELGFTPCIIYISVSLLSKPSTSKSILSLFLLHILYGKIV